MKMYVTRSWGVSVEEREVTRTTAASVFYIREGHKNEEREAKSSQWHVWHYTKEDAKNYLIKIKQNEIDSLNEKIKYLLKEIERVNQIELPF